MGIIWLAPCSCLSDVASSGPISQENKIIVKFYKIYELLLQIRNKRLYNSAYSTNLRPHIINKST